MTKANTFFHLPVSSPGPEPTKRKVNLKPPKYILERQDTTLVRGPWLSVGLYASSVPQYNHHMDILKNSRLPVYQRSRFRVRRLKDSVIVSEGQHNKLGKM